MSQTEAFLWSLAIEVPVVLALGSLGRDARRHLPRLALLAVAASTITHPVLWIVEVRMGDALPTWTRRALLEAAVTAVEAVVYAGPGRLGAWRGAGLSVVANAASFATRLPA